MPMQRGLVLLLSFSNHMSRPNTRSIAPKSVAPAAAAVPRPSTRSTTKKSAAPAAVDAPSTPAVPKASKKKPKCQLVIAHGLLYLPLRLHLRISSQSSPEAAKASYPAQSSSTASCSSVEPNHNTVNFRSSARRSRVMAHRIGDTLRYVEPRL